MNYKKVDYAIEATDNEAFFLWEKHHEAHSWQQNYHGYLATAKVIKVLGEDGTAASFPICVSLTWCVIDGRTVLFYEPTSRFVDWNVIHEFVKENLLNPRHTKTNAANPHIVFHAIRERNEREGPGTDKIQDMADRK